jgi:hypothetical protein
MNNSDNSYKSILKNYIILIALCLFVVIYIIINLDVVKRGDIYNGDLTKSILLTAIIILLIYLFVTWDDDIEDTIKYDEPIKITKFNLGSVSQPLVPIGNIPTNVPTVQTIKTVQTVKTIPTTGPNVVADQMLGQTKNKLSGESKYFIVNQTNPIKYSNPLVNLTNVQKSISNPGNFDNPNIFIAQKNIGKYGIKF